MIREFHRDPSIMRKILAFAIVLTAAVTPLFAADPTPVAEYYTEAPLYYSRPDPKSEKEFGDVGVTGLKVRIYPGVVVQVEETTPGSPAAGKFTKGEVITGVNGAALKGRNPYVVLGTALTEAEAKDGLLVFDVRSADGKDDKTVRVTIPAMGAYSPTWPLKCPKSEAIVKRAAEYYAGALKNAKDASTLSADDRETVGIPNALACLFLLSTGDDQYLPVVKSYFDTMSNNVRAIGDHTWNNGYNGIACAEYYLRTGDKSVLPVLQYICDDARNRQFYGIGWCHWGKQINPGYTAGGLMNSAGVQMATTLMLGKQCGVKVDDATLLGSLKFFYRFAGRGSVAYGDHRGEGGLGSNGKDGMVAALMQVAGAAQGNVEIYRQARNYLALSMLDSFPTLVTGHGDNGRGDAIWRSVTSAYMSELKPDAYRDTMKNLQWWYDLSRRPSGALGVATCQRFDDEGSGAAVAISYTAPLKTLQITGAPRSKFATDFKLPESLWGRPADLEFLSIEHGASYAKAGPDDSVHQWASRLGSAYSNAANHTGIDSAEIVRAAYHRNFMIRTQAAKALMHAGAFTELEKLMEDKDPRVRRAAVDGLTDYRYWFAVGKTPIRPEDVSPAMVKSMRTMLVNPNEAIYVVDGALLALSCATPAAVAECVADIVPWTTYDDWWVRQSAFMALATAAKADGVAAKVLPTLAEMLKNETRAQARESMSSTLGRLLKSLNGNSEAAQLIEAAYSRAAAETEVKTGARAGEGGYFVAEAAQAALKADPRSAPEIARIVSQRIQQLENRQIVTVVNALLPGLEKLPDTARQEVTDLLYNSYRQELIRRMDSGEKSLDTILALTQLKHSDLAWSDIGKPASVDRVWQYMSFEPEAKDFLHPREGKRFRDVTLPAGLDKWTAPEFDASQWSSGQAPIGVGVYKPKRGKTPVIENRSKWSGGEFILLRTTFEIDSLDHDFYRLGILAKQGYSVYLNGQKIYTYIWWNEAPEYRKIGLDADAVKYLKKGTNVLAIYANAAYVEGALVGQIDARLEGLKKADLLKEDKP